MSPDLWARFDQVAKAQGVDRSTVLREFIKWYIGEAGAKAPKRP